MSRIGNKFIPLPAGVDVTSTDGSVRVKGPKGELVVPIHAAVKIAVQQDPHGVQVSLANPETAPKSDGAIWGLMRQLIANAIEGVQKPFEKSLEFVGVGFKVALAGNVLTMDVGFSHQVKFELPKGIEAKIEKQVVTVSGIDKQLVGETAARIRRVKPPEPYKGKGIKYTTEVIRRKAGKAATKGA